MVSVSAAEADEPPPKEEPAPKEEPSSPASSQEEEERLKLIESRVLSVEQLCGRPNPTAPRREQISSFLVFQVHHKLLLLGTKAALPMAILVLLANVSFVVGLSLYQMRQCTMSISLVDGGLPGGVNQMFFRDQGNTFICTSNLVHEDDTTKNDPCLKRSPCTLAGLSKEDYNLKEDICTISFNGCYQSPSCLPPNITVEYDLADVGTLKLPHAGGVEVCDSYGWEEQICEGVVSVTYVTCPNTWTAIGAALGYSTLVQMAMIIVLLVLYLGLHFLLTGYCYTLSDFSQAWGNPGSTVEEVRTSRTSGTSGSV